MVDDRSSKASVLFCSSASISLHHFAIIDMTRLTIPEPPGVPCCMNAWESKGATLNAGLLSRATEVSALGLWQGWKGNKEGFFSS